MDRDLNTMLTTPFWVADWYVDPIADRLLRQGAEIKLEPKAMTLLAILASEPNKVFTRQELEDRAWAGTVVGYDALTSAIIKLRKAFDDSTKQPRIIETVSKRGYRLIAEVRLADSGDTVGAGASQPRLQRRLLQLAAGFIVVLTVIAVGQWWRSPGPGQIGTLALSSDKPTIVVLPFVNLSKDPQNKYFSNGLTDDLTTDLSKYSGLIVIARSSAFAYDNAAPDIKKIGKRLNAKYIVIGSVRRVQKRVRINVKLIDAGTGYTLWAERIDRQLQNIFQVQDDVTRKIIATLPVKVTEAEKQIAARRYTTSFAAYDLFLRARASYVQHNRESNQQAREYLRQAMQLDKNFARVYSLLALTYIDEYRFRWGADAKQSIDRALEYGKQAIALNKNLPQPYWVLGYVYLYGRQDHQRALQMGQKALALDPNHADGYALLAITNTLSDRPQRAITLIRIAMRLNPHYPSQYPSVLGYAHYVAGNYEAARTSLEKAIELNAERITPNVFLLAIYQRLGKTEEVQWQRASLLIIDPDLKVDAWAQRQPFLHAARRDALIKELKAAGLK